MEIIPCWRPVRIYDGQVQLFDRCEDRLGETVGERAGLGHREPVEDIGGDTTLPPPTSVPSDFTISWDVRLKGFMVGV